MYEYVLRNLNAGEVESSKKEYTKLYWTFLETLFLFSTRHLIVEKCFTSSNLKCTEKYKISLSFFKIESLLMRSSIYFSGSEGECNHDFLLYTFLETFHPRDQACLHKAHLHICKSTGPQRASARKGKIPKYNRNRCNSPNFKKSHEHLEIILLAVS